MEIKCLKSATTLLNRVSVEQQGLDLSKEVLWVSVCQRAAKLPGGKVGGFEKKFCHAAGFETGRAAEFFFHTSIFDSW